MTISNFFAFCIIILLVTRYEVTNGQFKPDWPSLDTRPLPLWYDQSKFGIFMHWGVYAVPSFGSEWFWYNWKSGDPATVAFMRENYKPNFQYVDFAPEFTNEFFDPQQIAKIVKNSGARYVVVTSKHHEGYTMYPSNYSWNWNAWDVGPHRDLVGELADEIRKLGLHFGLYYSLFAWFHPLYMKDKQKLYSSKEYVESVVTPQLSEIVNWYKPEVIWSDGDWEASYQYWNSTEFLAWLYNESPVKDTIVVNDRWGIGATCKHGDFYTCTDKFNPGVLVKHKWENCMTIDRYSWGFRRTASYADFLTIQELIAELTSTISCGGNLLLNVGPTHDGRITPIFEERLSQLGQFVSTNEEAIFGTKPWIYQNDTKVPNVWYTSRLKDSPDLDPRRMYNPQKKKLTVVYAFVLSWPKDNTLILGAPKGTSETKVSILGYEGTLRYKVDTESGEIAVDFSTIEWPLLPNTWAWALKFENLAYENRKPDMMNPETFVKTLVKDKRTKSGSPYV